MLISFEAIHLYVLLLILAVTLIGLWMQGKSLSYLFFCGVFGLYLIGVVSVVVFPVHIPEKISEFNYELQLNLIPFYFGRCEFLSLCIRNVSENIFLTVPFGFGISFIVKIDRRTIPGIAVLVGITFEFIQLVISLLARSSFRIIDINDVILNATGVLLGYSLFRGVGWLYLHIIQRFEIRNKYLFAYMSHVFRGSADR